MSENRETPLGRALRRIAKGTRLSSLDVPVLDDAADEIDALTARLQQTERMDAERDALEEALRNAGRVLAAFVTKDHDCRQAITAALAAADARRG